jgi:two-component system, chemotaxis family, sensor kinase CheA
MDAQDRKFLDRLKATFRAEAEEHIQAISAGVVELEKDSSPEKRAERIEIVFREAHSLKGAARSVGFKDVEAVCHSLESAFAVLKDNSIALSPRLCDLILKTLDVIARLVGASGENGSVEDRAAVSELIRELAFASEGVGTDAGKEEEKPSESPTIPTSAAKAEAQAPGGAAPVDTVRIPAARLDALLLQAEELVLAKIAASQRVADAQGLARSLASLRVETERRDDRRASSGNRLDAIENGAGALVRSLEGDFRSIRRMVDEHLEAMKKAAMLPVASLTAAFPKMVRDLAREQGKEIDLVVLGQGIEIDKRVLEELKAPLLHLVRNCVDHGIRVPAQRVERGKPPSGAITISFAALDSRRAEVIVSDDGEGIDVERVREAAIRSGVAPREAVERMDPDEALSLVFRSGISTSPIITDLSGRGLGLAIVREKVEKLGGTVSVETHAHGGTTFRLVVPLTLATFRGVLVRACDQVFALPTINVERAVRVSRSEMETIENRKTIRVEGQMLPLVRLSDALGRPFRPGQPTRSEALGPSDHLYAVILSLGDKRIAFEVDEILDELQIMVKNLGKQLKRVRYVAGATVLGSGDLALVLNVSDLMKSAVQAAASAQPTGGVEGPPSEKGRVLVAEDSITSRMLLKNILVAAGYQVTTAVDGADAYEKARAGEIDLVVSDVDMPRMSGFELCARMRGDERLAHMPVVLVTALESREDRERGIDSGASAYIVKSSFDQSNLLETIRRLI